MSLQEIQDLRRRLEEEQRLREKEQQLREQAERSQIQAEEQLKLQTQETTPRNSLMPAMCTYFSGYLSKKAENRRPKAIRPTLRPTKGWPQPPRSRQKAGQSRTSRPRADQFSVYNKGPQGKVPAFIIEYKAPQQVSLAHIRAGLQGMDLDEVLRLHDNQLDLTAVGQLLAFTHCALRVPVRDIDWTTWAASKLRTWEMIYDDLLEEIAEKDIPASDFKPSTRSRLEYCCASPVKTRSWSAAVAACNLSRGSRSSSYDDCSDGFDPHAPSRGRARESCCFLTHRPPHLYRRYRSQEDPPRKESPDSIAQKCLLGQKEGNLIGNAEKCLTMELIDVD
ncbi:hypothetical protein BBP40_000218 [Aspergillus hancockii]|nr:hypothetical protein BBP40_000218 [Aspergillus hancockii]